MGELHGRLKCSSIGMIAHHVRATSSTRISVIGFNGTVMVGNASMGRHTRPEVYALVLSSRDLLSMGRVA